MLYKRTVKFDMLRVRVDGWLAPRHNSGLIRAVRGRLHVADERVPNLNRTCRVASFHTEGGEVIKLLDVVLLNATAERIVLSGFENNFVGLRETAHAQTWVLYECEGDEPRASMGPAFTT